MTVTVEQLKQTAQTILQPDAEVRVIGTSGETYPVKLALAYSDALTITVEDGVGDGDEDSDDDEDED